MENEDLILTTSTVGFLLHQLKDNKLKKHVVFEVLGRLKPTILSIENPYFDEDAKETLRVQKYEFAQAKREAWDLRRDLKKDLGRALRYIKWKDWRKKHGLTQKELCKTLDICKQMLSQAELGRYTSPGLCMKLLYYFATEEIIRNGTCQARDKQGSLFGNR